MSTRDVEQVIRHAVDEAVSRRHEYITVEHLLWALLQRRDIADVLERCDADVHATMEALDGYLKKEIPTVAEGAPDTAPARTVGFGRVLERAVMQVQYSGRSDVEANDILVAIAAEEDSFGVWLLARQGATLMALQAAVSHDDDDAPDREGPAWELPSGAAAKRSNRKKVDPLSAYTVCLTDRADTGQVEPLVGRDDVLESLARVLCRRTRNNPVLLGEPGVGKTAIVHGLCARIVAGRVPAPLARARVYLMEIGSLLSGTRYRGQMEERVKGVLDALSRQENPVLFIDDIHLISGAGQVSGSAVDVSNLLKPALSGGRIRCIGATTWEDYKRTIEHDKALARRFQKIEVVPDTVDSTIEVLRGLRPGYEAFHEVAYSDEALRAAAELSDRHIPERFLPDKAIDLIDECGAANRLRSDDNRATTIEKSHIREIVSKVARIPEIEADADDRDRLFHLESRIRAKLFGQDHAVAAVVQAIQLSRAGLSAPSQPVGSFLFAGPTGVGKTELARQLAHHLAVPFIRFDMSEYMEKHTVSRLIGAPPGYVGFEQGGLLTDAIRRTPHAVLLLDEIEKAHGDLFDILLQVMDHGELTDNNGAKARFQNVVLIMTSNAGSRDISKKGIGFSRGVDTGAGDRELERLFSPEFRNRLTDIVRFSPLSREHARCIVRKFIDELSAQAAERRVTIDVTDEAVDRLAQDGFDDVFGARPLKRLIEKTVRRALAERILFGDLKDGGRAEVTVQDGAVTVL